MGEAVPSSFYVPLGEDRFESTALTRGPWSGELQHGGPPCALLARAAQRHGPDAQGFLVARLTVDYLRPVPVGPLRVVVEPLRLGKGAQRLAVSLLAGDTELVRASVLRLRRRAVEVDTPRPAPPPVAPDALAPTPFPWFPDEVAYHRGVEVRYADGSWGASAVTVWMRALFSVVAGEESSGLERLMLLADAQSGVCTPVDFRRFTFVNPDLTVVVDREPVGEWLAFDVVSTASAQSGVGLAQSALFDRQGQVGRSAQTVLVEPRAG